MHVYLDCTCVACVVLYVLEFCILYYMDVTTGNVKKLENSVKSDEQAISKLKDEEKNKLEVYSYDIHR